MTFPHNPSDDEAQKSKQSLSNESYRDWAARTLCWSPTWETWQRWVAGRPENKSRKEKPKMSERDNPIVVIATAEQISEMGKETL